MKIKSVGKVVIGWLLVGSMMVGCGTPKAMAPAIGEELLKPMEFTYEVKPETFEISLNAQGKSIVVSDPQVTRQVADFKEQGDQVSWSYPNEAIKVNLEKKEDYLRVAITTENAGTNTFAWPEVTGENYILPLGEGKQFSGDDQTWQRYLDGETLKVMEAFSMQFFAFTSHDLAAMYIIENPYDNQVSFKATDGLKMTFHHEFPSLNEDKTYGFRIYMTSPDPVSVAKTYKAYMIEQGHFTTLAKKATENNNVEKLYGAPHIYFYPGEMMAIGDVNWPLFKENFSSDLKEWMQSLLNKKIEDGAEFAEAFDELNKEAYVPKYLQKQVVHGLTQVLMLEDFYQAEVFPNPNQAAGAYLSKGVDTLTQAEIVAMNKELLKGALGEALLPVDQWAKAETVDILDEMAQGGIKEAWLGFDGWQQALIKPEFVQKAQEMGYLIGPYDSYHSIHPQGEEKWDTAAFSDPSLYEEATVEDEQGKKYMGFKNEGRKLNPTLAMPSVRERVEAIQSNGLGFNSWFIDCDAFGEIFNDYNKNHPTTQAQDLAARLERMAYIRDTHRMVVGSEGGNDFANDTIAFAHGIETPAFDWMDPDMKSNKESPYYVGRYYAPNGGAPEIFTKQVDLKDYFEQLFISPIYSVPLYKLVYNDVVITTHQWAWPTLKVKNALVVRQLKEILYNVPPLYQIDAEQWALHKEEIIDHTKAWSTFSKEVINLPMTDYQVISEDGLVQMTKFGQDHQVVANFSDQEVTYQGHVIQGKSLIMVAGEQVSTYQPLAAKTR